MRRVRVVNMFQACVGQMSSIVVLLMLVKSVPRFFGFSVLSLVTSDIHDHQMNENEGGTNTDSNNIYAFDNHVNKLSTMQNYLR
jgi:hypothetical protein